MLLEFYSKLSELVKLENNIPYKEYSAAGIAKGLRKSNGEGILVGITNVCDNYGKLSGEDCEGKIFYRGVDLQTIIDDIHDGKRHTYEEIAYLLLFGQWPEKDLLNFFLKEQRKIHNIMIPELERIINQETGQNLMNNIARCILNLYDCDADADDTSMENMIRQAIILITLMPVISVNVYRKKTCSVKGSFNLATNEKITTAENILYMLRNGTGYTQLESEILNICLILHAELGGGNNSAFTTQVVASTGTDTYSVIAAAIGSIKGPKHGGANIKAFQMFQEMKKRISNWEDEASIDSYLRKIIHKEAFDGSGLIYGVGHAVFTLSDPRTEILKEMARKLSQNKGREEEFMLYERVEKMAPLIIQKEKHVSKHFCANVDYYSGFIYDMLGIPVELFTPMFVNARIAGWCAHRMEEMCNGARIIHPTYRMCQKNV